MAIISPTQERNTQGAYPFNFLAENASTSQILAIRDYQANVVAYIDGNGLFRSYKSAGAFQGPNFVAGPTTPAGGAIVAASTIPAYALVKQSATANQVEPVATTDTADKAVGASNSSSAINAGSQVPVVVCGLCYLVSDGVISAGAGLKPSGTTAGRVIAASAGDKIVGFAVTAATAAGQNIVCWLGYRQI